ncbi:MAG: tetratricopeptide repeat protein [Gammaproteobacteria bacterium]|nr:tetratricopeptide repeat protein [Gammaproteobacteria bacterium]NNF60029.1 tetratricopeptide repeat protein [Gammaproteobacteria bacterium]NNM19960.1 tetratricopeptide repeat protein [Gammaproteobacteria bacterium]
MTENAGWWDELKRRNVVRVGIAYAVMGWIAAQAAQILFEVFEAPAWVAKVVVSLIVLGFPFAIFFAWAFELTPQGLKRTYEVDADESITHNTGRKVDFVIIVALAVAVIFLGWDKLSNRNQPAATAATAQITDGAPVLPAGGGGKDPASIAVLPFVNMSADPEQEFFSDGISEELLNLLARIPNLKVAARTSSFAFKGRNENISAIADTLKVAKVLEGSVRKAGTKLRITAQLIEADTGYHLWSDTFDRELDDVFAIQDEIAAAIVTALEQTLGLRGAAPATARTSNLEAYNAYLEGRQLMEQRGQGPLEAAQVMLEKAVALDPEFAPAYSSLAEAVLLLPGYRGAFSNREAIERAQPLVERALELAPDSADSLVAQAFLLEQDQRPEEAIAVYDQVLELNPNMVRALMWRASTLGEVGRYEEQLESLRRAVMLDPLGYVPVQNTAVQLQVRGEFDEAVATIEKLVRVRPSVTSYAGLASILSAQGKKDRAHEIWLKARDIAPDNQGIILGLKWIYSDLDMLEQFRQLESASPLDEVWLVMLERRWPEAAQIMEQLVANEPPGVPSLVRNIAANSQLFAGNPQRALEHFQPVVNSTTGTVGPLFATEADPLVTSVIAARRLAGDGKGAQELIGLLRSYHDETVAAGHADPETLLREAQLLTLEGQTEASMARLREVVDMGWTGGDLLLYWSFMPLHNDPEFQQIHADWERERERQRQAIREQLGLSSSGRSRQIL